jgi:hypothetical protein
MLRRGVAWGLIALGLAAVVGGCGMAYLASFVNQADVESERAQARMIFHADNVTPPPRSGGMLPYVIAAVSIVGGGALVCVGVSLRNPPAGMGARSKKKKRRKEDLQACAACGGFSPPSANACYQCGIPFQPKGA